MNAVEILPPPAFAAASPAPADARIRRPAIKALGIGIAFGALKVVDGIDLCVYEGERRLLLGPNGAGKTTLLNLIAGDLRATCGTLHLFDADVTTEPTQRRARRGLARTYQIITLFRESSLLHNVQISLAAAAQSRWSAWRPFGNPTLARHAREVLERVELDRKADALVDSCSYGEMRRLEIALALAQNPRILLLDEPLAGLSGAERSRVGELLAALPRDLTIIMIEHDMDIALVYADTITVLQSGRVAVDGNKREVLSDPRTQEIYLGH